MNEIDFNVSQIKQTSQEAVGAALTTVESILSFPTPPELYSDGNDANLLQYSQFLAQTGPDLYIYATIKVVLNQNLVKTTSNSVKKHAVSTSFYLKSFFKPQIKRLLWVQNEVLPSHAAFVASPLPLICVVFRLPNARWAV